MVRAHAIDPAEGSIGDRMEFMLLALVVFFSPMNFLRLPMVYFTLSDAFACIAFLYIILRGRLTLQPIGSAPSAFWYLGLALMLGFLMASSLINGDPVRGTIYVIQYFFAYYLVFIVLCRPDERRMIALMKIYILSIIVMCLHGIFIINVLGEKNTMFVSGSGRLMGFVERENECAALFALSVALLLYLVRAGKVGWYWIAAVPLIAYGIMLTGSNTGLASFALSVGLMAVMTIDWRIVVPAGIAAGFAGSFMLTVGRDYLPEVFQRRVLGALESGDLAQAGTFDHRVELIREAMGRVGEIGLFGMGAEQYQVHSFLEAPVHNLYLLLWTEGGFLCLFGFIVMLLAAFGPGLTALRVTRDRTAAALTLTSVALFALVVNAFPSIYGRFWVVPVFLAVGTTHALNLAWFRRQEQASWSSEDGG